MTAPLLLLIDDDAQLTGRLAGYLQRTGFRTRTACSIAAAQDILREIQPDLLVLDWNLPDRDGLGQLARWRANGIAIPVLMLSGNVSAGHRVAGLQGGADDYLTKPFDIQELVARIQALLRRSAPGRQPAAPVIHFGPYAFDTGAARLTRSGEPVPLAAAELALLMIFCQHANRILDREQLLALTGDSSGERLDRSIDLRVARLRDRLGDDARSPRWLVTVRGQGYRLDGEQRLS